MGIRRVGVGIAIAGVTALAAVLLVVPAVGAGTAVPGDDGTPLAEAGLDQQVRHGETVRLDATGSYDPDGTVVGYEWRVRTPGGRTVSPLEPRGARTSFRATVVGRYEVTLTVTDDEGNAGTDTMYVLVEPGDAGAGTTPASASDTRESGDEPGSPDATSGTPASEGDASVSTAARSVSGCEADGGRLDGSCSAPGVSATSEPWAHIEGPSVVRAERSYTYTATAGGLADDRTYEWEDGDAGRRHTLVFESPGGYIARVAVDGAEGRTASASMEVFVSPAGNERPEVEIADPGRISAGQRLTLSVDANDPDGRIRTTEWSPSRRVRVPDDGTSRTVRVTVTDDDGASVTDSITLSGRAWNRTDVDTGTAEVTCYYTDERQRDGRHPYSDRCVFEGGNTVSLSTGPSRIEEIERDPNVEIEWRRTTRERLAELRANDTSRDHGRATGSSYDRADLFGYSEDLLSTGIVGQRATADGMEAFTLKGRTVEDDLNGDGEVNAADWDRVYRTTGDLANVDRDADTVGAFKRSIREGGNGERDDGDGGVLETAERADARSVDGPFAGTSIDAENRRDRIARLGSREATRDASGPGTPDGTAPSERDGSTGRSTDGSTLSSNDRGESDGAPDAGGPDSTSTDGTEGTDSTGSNGAARHGTDQGTEGESRHSSHGGRFVTHP